MTAEVPVNLKVVQTLEKYLAMAKAGQLTSASIAAMGPMGNVMLEYSVNDQQRISLLGSMTLLQDLMVKDLRHMMSSMEPTPAPSSEAVQ